MRLGEEKRKPLFDYERMLYKALVEPVYLNITIGMETL
jgi:hypothetical protein